MYSSDAQTQNYLSGVQVSDANGEVTFTTTFPGCYPCRWPHIHFEIYDSLDQATSGHNAARISQLALPEDLCRQVYAQTSLYPGRA
jgi:protocatechuate 3,4-dioxygenase beta subunit